MTTTTAKALIFLGLRVKKFDAPSHEYFDCNLLLEEFSVIPHLKYERGLYSIIFYWIRVEEESSNTAVRGYLLFEVEKYTTTKQGSSAILRQKYEIGNYKRLHVWLWLIFTSQESIFPFAV
ncbi:hypothetical protein SUGI_1008890 [Cryptomeria japonica]|nr:hypothetical protein SUGI_1008890 [Cryptomeria japonica]